MVLRADNFAYRWPEGRDLSERSRPPHVRVIGPKGEAVFLLHCPAGPPTLRGSHSFTTTELNCIGLALGDALRVLCRGWERIHEHYR
jgi:hypothetical protein